MRSDACSDGTSYDVFLSYNSADHCLVEDIARKLRHEGIKPFLAAAAERSESQNNVSAIL
jgi:hypothetical protein